MVDLELIGRHALFFDDDANAVFVNSEEALVDWYSLLIDRYDVRHLLSGPPPPRNRRRQAIPLADASIATELDRERYLDLPSDEQEQENNEEVLPVSDDGYRAVGFSYGNPEATEQKNKDVESVYHPPFLVPESLTQNLPPTEKVHQIMARTATFVSEHGGQSEIVLRVKQGDNPTFGFLMPDHRLHPYFRFLVDHQELLKSNGDGKQENTGDKTLGQTGGALSLLGSLYGNEEEDDGLAEDLSDAKINKSPENVDIFSASVTSGPESSGNTAVKKETPINNSIKEKMNTIKRNTSINLVKSFAPSAVKKDVGCAGTSTTKTLTSAVSPSIAKVEMPVLEPPSELKRVVEKIVEFILRNGREFEAILAEQDRKFGRFPFLFPTNLYHSYYLQVLQKTQEYKLTGKVYDPEKHEPSESKRDKKTSRRDVSLSNRISDGDIPSDYDKKEKFKMALGKTRKSEQELPPKVKQPPSEVVIDAEAAAAILKAATRGNKDSGLEIFPKQESHSNGVNKKTAIGDSSVSNASDADSSEASLTKEQKLKAERLKRAKMFAAMLKNGAKPLKPEPIRGLSLEPASSGVSSPGNDAAKREGSSAPVDSDSLEKIEKSVKKAIVDECTERRSRRSYRPRSKREEEEEEENDDDEDHEKDRRDEGRLKKKHRSHRSSRKRRSSSKLDDDDENDDRYRYRSSDDDDRKRRKSHRKHRSSDDDHRGRNYHSSRADKRKEAELEEGEIFSAKSDQSKKNESREASVDLLKSPSGSAEAMDIPDDLRAKIRAMLMATM